MYQATFQFEPTKIYEKQDQEKKERLHSETITAVSIMKYCEPFQGVLRDIGHDLFYVH